jgi:hypothetical protein
VPWDAPARELSAGKIGLLLIDLNTASWTRLITGGLTNDVIQLPPASHSLKVINDC